MRKLVLPLAAALVVALAVIAAPAGASDAPKPFDAREYKRTHGYLPLKGVATLERAKQHAADVVASWNKAPSSDTSFEQAAASPNAPIIGASFDGISQSNLTPPDANGAIGPSSFIETVNQMIAIYTRTGSLIASASFSSLTGNGSGSDPMILWDPHTQRFYYNIWNTSNARMDWGFSKSANPTSIPGDFCRYETAFGYPSTSFPDYPKLGQTKEFILIGINFYPTPSSQAATQTDVLWINKPQGSGTITTCPSATSFGSGRFQDLRNEDNTIAFTPVPAIQTDPSSNGYVVASSDIECPPICGTGTLLTVFTVSPNPSNPSVPQISAPDSMTVGSFQSPPDAPQKGTSNKLDTLDGRLTHAVSGFDPRIGATTVWTGHAVLGGAGSQVRWYEVNPATGTVVQTGTATHSTFYVFDAGISNDRTCTLTQCAHGDSMVLGVTASSSTAYPLIGMVSKVGAGAQSGPVLVHSSTTFDRNFSCTPCRWGDYGGATPDPDPALLTATRGKVWLSQQYTKGGSFFESGDDTWNWEATP